MKYEKPQTGNPHRLTIKQHIFPRRCVARFENSKSRVQVRLAQPPKSFEVTAEDAIFCAMRVWDQRTETLHSHKIENAYSALADKIASGEIVSLDTKMNEIVTHFHALCSSRFEANSNRRTDVQLNDVLAEPDLDKDKQEMLEKMGVLFVGPDGKMPARTITGLTMVAKWLHLSRADNYPQWGIWRARDGEFLVADNFMKIRCVPVTPSIMLCADSGNFDLEFEAVAELNAFNASRAERFYFARDFEACPIYRRTIPNRRFSTITS
jgi:hypothetical protein